MSKTEMVCLGWSLPFTSRVIPGKYLTASVLEPLFLLCLLWLLFDNSIIEYVLFLYDWISVLSENISPCTWDQYNWLKSEDFDQMVDYYFLPVSSEINQLLLQDIDTTLLSIYFSKHLLSVLEKFIFWIYSLSHLKERNVKNE